METEQASITEIVWFYTPSSVLICRLCGSRVRAGSRHFRSRYGLKGLLLQDILAYEKEVSPVDPVVAAIPLDGSSRILQLVSI